MILHLRRAHVMAGKLPVGNAWPPMLCGVKEQGLRWTTVDCATESTPFAFVMPFSWEDTAFCVDCVRAARRCI